MDDPNTVNLAVANLKNLLRQQTLLREVAEKRSRESRDALLGVAQSLCKNAMDHVKRKEPQGLKEWDANQIADFIVTDVGQRLDQMDMAQIIGEKDIALLARITQLEKQLEDTVSARKQADERAHVAESQIVVLKETIVDLQQRFDALQRQSQPQPQPSAVPPAALHSPAPQLRFNLGPEPEWMQEWRETRTFERASQLVIVLGNTGKCRRPQLSRIIGEMTNRDPKTSAVKRTFDYAQSADLIEIIKFKQIKSGGGSHLVKLTPKGQQAYLYLTKTQAQPSILDELLKRHKSLEHAYLNLEAADLLTDFGYSVDLYPPELSLPGGGTFRPDLKAVSPDGELLWVEAERDPKKYGKERRERHRKWNNYYEATGGHFVIITANRRAMMNVRSEIAWWGRSHRQLRFWITNISEVQAGKRGPDNDLWLYK